MLSFLASEISYLSGRVSFEEFTPFCAFLKIPGLLKGGSCPCWASLTVNVLSAPLMENEGERSAFFTPCPGLPEGTARTGLLQAFHALCTCRGEVA